MRDWRLLKAFPGMTLADIDDSSARRLDLLLAVAAAIEQERSQPKVDVADGVHQDRHQGHQAGVR